MKTISIRELHAATGKWVKEAARLDEIVITDRGRPVAAIVPYTHRPEANPFLTRKLRPGYARLLGRLQRGTDSRLLVSEGRERP